MSPNPFPNPTPPGDSEAKVANLTKSPAAFGGLANPNKSPAFGSCRGFGASPSPTPVDCETKVISVRVSHQDFQLIQGLQAGER